MKQGLWIRPTANLTVTSYTLHLWLKCFTLPVWLESLAGKELFPETWFRIFHATLPSGIIPDRHKRHAWASEPGEAVSCLQRLPQSLLGNGCREKRRRQRAAPGYYFFHFGSLVFLFNLHSIHLPHILLLRVCSIPSWSWRSPSPASHRSSWQPRRPWRGTVS